MDKKGAKGLRLSLWWGMVIAAVFGLILGKDVVPKASVTVICILGSIAAISAMLEHGWLRAPVPIGTPVRAPLLVIIAVGVMTSVGWFAWPSLPDKTTRTTDTHVTSQSVPIQTPQPTATGVPKQPTAIATPATRHAALPNAYVQAVKRNFIGPHVEPVPQGDPDMEKLADMEKKLFDMNTFELLQYVSTVVSDLRKFDPHWHTPVQAERLDREVYGDAPNAQAVLAEEVAKREARKEGYLERYWSAFYSTFPYLGTLQTEVVKHCPNGVDPTDLQLRAPFNVPNNPGLSAIQSAAYLEELARDCLKPKLP